MDEAITLTPPLREMSLDMTLMGAGIGPEPN
jgi:hypothetical protein